MTEKLKNKINDEQLKIRAISDEKITVKLTNNYAFQKIFKNTKIVKGFLMNMKSKKLKLQIHLHWEKMMKKKKEFWTSN